MRERLLLPGGVVATIHTRGEHTGGAFTLLTDRLPPGWRLPPHTHAAESETILVTSGRLAMHMDGKAIELAEGDSVVISPRVLHDGATLGPEPVERVVVFSPSGMERFFEALATTTSTAAALHLAEQHGWRFG